MFLVGNMPIASCSEEVMLKDNKTLERNSRQLVKLDKKWRLYSYQTINEIVAANSKVVTMSTINTSINR